MLFDLSASKRAKRDLGEKVASAKKENKRHRMALVKIEIGKPFPHFYIIGHEMPNDTEKDGS